MRTSVGLAREAAVDWVDRDGSRQAGFRGAYFSGSTVGLAAEAELPTGSDVDVVVVTEGAGQRPKLGKFLHRGTLLEVTYLPWNRIASAERVLAAYHLAGSFRVDTVIADPTGELRCLHAAVSRRFAEEVWVRRRCEGARRRIEDGLRGLDPSAPWHDQVTAWLFGTGVTTHVLLVAALRRLLGCQELDQDRAGRHLDSLAETFDTAAAVARTPFFFSSDITPAARRIAIDASGELIRSGRHREAVFWMVATFARCHKILAADAPVQVQRALAPAFDRILEDLGVASPHDLLARASSVVEFLPRLWSAAEAILSSNPGISRAVTNTR